MEIKGKLIQKQEPVTGTGKNGTTWKKQEIILETEGQYPKKVCINVWGDKIEESKLQPGTMLNVSFDLESREYNGRWYTDVKAWKVDVLGMSSAPSSPAQSKEQSYSEPALPQSASNDDLPF